MNEMAMKAIRFALALVYKRHYDKPFHGPRHTFGVIRRFVALALAMDLNPRETTLGIICTAFHDTVYNWDPVVKDDGSLILQPRSGLNEENSFKEMRKWLMLNPQYEVSETEMTLMTQGIKATVARWDHVKETVFQPNLQPDSHPLVRGVALADLGTRGMTRNPAVACRESNGLFREQQRDIGYAIATGRVWPRQAKRYRDRMMSFLEGEVGVGEGRKFYFEDELGDLPTASKDRVRGLFIHFDPAIKAAINVVKTRQRMDFWPLALAMGYDIPTYKMKM